VTISFRLHSELDVLIKYVKVIKEFSQLAGSMRPDDECVIHVAKPAEGLVGAPMVLTMGRRGIPVLWI
jgi:hypothetical protein